MTINQYLMGIKLNLNASELLALWGRWWVHWPRPWAGYRVMHAFDYLVRDTSVLIHSVRNQIENARVELNLLPVCESPTPTPLTLSCQRGRKLPVDLPFCQQGNDIPENQTRRRPRYVSLPSGYSETKGNQFKSICSGIIIWRVLWGRWRSR